MLHHVLFRDQLLLHLYKRRRETKSEGLCLFKRENRRRHFCQILDIEGAIFVLKRMYDGKSVIEHTNKDHRRHQSPFEKLDNRGHMFVICHGNLVSLQCTKSEGTVFSKTYRRNCNNVSKIIMFKNYSVELNYKIV